MQMKRITFDYYADPAHGWVRVNKKILREFWGMTWRKFFSPFSYERGDWAYLEEDRDAHVLQTGLKDARVEVSYRQHHTDKSSRIRNYQPLQPIGD